MIAMKSVPRCGSSRAELPEGSVTRWRQKGNEPPFAIAQGVLLVLFIAAGIRAVGKVRPEQTISMARAA
jgi:hypothetical protein